MGKKKQEKRALRAEQKRVRIELNEKKRQYEKERQLDKEKPAKGLNRLTQSIHGLTSAAMSNLRFSLTLRIALHYAGQLLRTTLFALLVMSVVFAVAQIPTINDTLDSLTQLQPPQDGQYTAEQLVGLPLSSAYTLDEPMQGGLAGFGDRLSLLFSGLGQKQLRVYTEQRGVPVVAAFSMGYWLYVYSLMFWALLATDLFRMVYFLRKRSRLNKKVLRPISEMAKAAEQLSANNLSLRFNIAGTKNELKDLANVINGMLDRIELSYNSQKQFVSDASHELRTPIAVIQGYASMLERWGKTDKEVLDEGITAISQETEAMKELVERLLFLARHDKKTLMLEMEVFDPLEVMSAVHREAQMISSQHTFSLSPAMHGLIKADKGMMKQLMRILVDNAIKYTPAGGTITLGVASDGDACTMTVTDTGAGISAQELPRIFDRFYRSDKARKAQSSGHGLGLSIARIIVVAHGGKLSVRSKEGVGTTFTVTLPTSNEETA